MIDNLIKEIENLKQENNKTIIAIDGFGGSGKSTLAKNINSHFSDSKILELDWFYFPQDQIIDDICYDYKRLINEIINPYKANKENVSFRKYNWGFLANKEDLSEEVLISFKEVNILIIEGCTTLDKRLSAYFDFKIWVDTNKSTSHKRGINRDINEYGLNPEKVKEIWSKWNEWEERTLIKDNRKSRANFILKYS